MEQPSFFPLKIVKGKYNPWLHFNPQQGLVLGDRSGKISTPGCGPPVPPDLYSTQEGHPSWFPLVPSDWGIWASPLETDQGSCPGWIPLVSINVVSPQEGILSWSPYPYSYILPCHQNFANYVCVFSKFIKAQFSPNFSERFEIF